MILLILLFVIQSYIFNHLNKLNVLDLSRRKDDRVGETKIK